MCVCAILRGGDLFSASLSVCRACCVFLDDWMTCVNQISSYKMYQGYDRTFTKFRILF